MAGKTQLERLNPATAGRPDLMGNRTSLTVYARMTGIGENVFLNVNNRSHTITADVTTPKGGANGLFLAQGGRFAGWSLYLKDGTPAYTYKNQRWPRSEADELAEEGHGHRERVDERLLGDPRSLPLASRRRARGSPGQEASRDGDAVGVFRRVILLDQGIVHSGPKTPARRDDER